MLSQQTGTLVIENYGPIRRMQLPPHWYEEIEEDVPFNLNKGRTFRPPVSSEATGIWLVSHGKPLGIEASAAFLSVLQQPAHALSEQEMESIAAVFQYQLGDPQVFQCLSIQTRPIFDHMAVLVEGIFKKQNWRTLRIYMDADCDGQWVQEAYYGAPAARYGDFIEAAKACFSTIELRRPAPGT